MNKEKESSVIIVELISCCGGGKDETCGLARGQGEIAESVREESVRLGEETFSHFETWDILHVLPR